MTLSAAKELLQTFLPVPVELVVAFSICDDIKLTWVLYVAWTLRLILSISLIVSSFPWRISNSFQVCQKLAVTWKIKFINISRVVMTCTSLTEMLHLIQKQAMAGVGLAHPGITDLGTVGVDCSGSVNLTKFTLHVSKSLAHVPRMLIRKDLYEYKGTISILVLVIWKKGKKMFSIEKLYLLYPKISGMRTNKNQASLILWHWGKSCKLIKKLNKKTLDNFITPLHSKPCNFRNNRMI